MDVLAKQKLRRHRANCNSSLYIHAEHTAANHRDDSSRYLSVDKQGFVRKAMKTAPNAAHEHTVNTAAKLIKNVQDSPTKQIDPKLKAT